jgi:hypothetical protein
MLKTWSQRTATVAFWLAVVGIPIVGWRLFGPVPLPLWGSVVVSLAGTVGIVVGVVRFVRMRRRGATW